jgi:hypothetical protein
LIAPPDGRRDLRNLVEYASGASLVTSEAPRTLHGLGDIRNVSALPQPDLVAEDPESTCPPAADGALGDHAALLAAPVVDRRLLDDESAVWDFNLERGVIESTCGAMLQSSRHRLVYAPVEPYEVPTGAEGQPVEVDGRRNSKAVHVREYRKALVNAEGVIARLAA